MSFKKIFDEHLSRVQNKLLNVGLEFNKRAINHDRDKIFNKEVNDVYEEYFAELKKIKFGTPKYYEFEKKNFEKAHQIHAQNRHHFYSSKNNINDVNLFDLMEAIVDISESSKQYGGNREDIYNALKNKKIFDQELEQIIMNTLDYLNEKENK